jgi:uncharacterized membrane protein
MSKEFSRHDTKIMKGVAVILMLMHHLWFCPDRLSGNLKYLINCFQNSSIYYLGSFGQICVSLFFFLGGYGLWCISKKGKLDILNNIKKLYISYWKVFLVFIPIGFIFFSKQETSAINSAYILRFNNFS